MIYTIAEFNNSPNKTILGDYGNFDIQKMFPDLEVKSTRQVFLAENAEEKKRIPYYKVIWGFDEERVTEIEEKDLEKALYAMSTKGKVYLGDVLLDGKYIIAIKEDYNKTMGWLPTHELDADDWIQIREEKVDSLFAGKVYEAKLRVQNRIDNKLLAQGQKQLN